MKHAQVINGKQMVLFSKAIQTGMKSVGILFAKRIKSCFPHNLMLYEM